MPSLTTLAALFGFAVAGTNAAVINLTNENYATSIASGGTWFVKYYAPWCGHCKKLAPTWEELSGAVPEGVHIAHVDCTVAQDVCTSQDVKGYPTLKIHKDGSTEGERYNGGRDMASLKAAVA